MYSNLADEAKVLGRLEIKGKHITDYGLIFGQNAKTLVYEPLLDKFDTLKQKIQKDTKNSGGANKTQQESSGGAVQAYDPFESVKEGAKENDKTEEVLESSVRGIGRGRGGKSNGQRKKGTNEFPQNFKKLEQSPEESKAQAAGNSDYSVDEEASSSGTEA